MSTQAFERRHVGDTLFWQNAEPVIGQRFTTPSGLFEILTKELLMGCGSGWLMLVKAVEPRR